MNLQGRTSAELREHYLAWVFLPTARELLRRRQDVRGVVLAVGKYYCDEAYDAVHTAVVPVLAGHPPWPPVWEGLPRARRPFDLAAELGSIREALWGSRWPFHFDNDRLIPAFATFCRPWANQEMELAEAYSPYAVLWRSGEIELLGVPLQGGWEDALARPSRASDPALLRGSPRVAGLEGRDLDTDELLELLEAEDVLRQVLPLAERALGEAEADGFADRTGALAELAGWSEDRDPEGPVPAVVARPLPPSNRLYGVDPDELRRMAHGWILAPLGRAVGRVSLVVDPAGWRLRVCRGRTVGPTSAELARVVDRLTGGRGLPVGPSVERAFGACVRDGSPGVVATWEDGKVSGVPVEPAPPASPRTAWDHVELGAACLDVLDQLAMVARWAEAASWGEDPARALDGLRTTVERARALLYEEVAG
ncbi:MAG: hypothetical protein KC656_14925 [Myxococcales bacterium]|nr:hypothetical protein [Myxococcales bacterium]MCB9673059.1 hypothetical protein [Alphaproteobacteria bacterium]MCB9694897.1 hypothetical protein [Alphaproteobacteria bacterium]